MVCKTHHSYLMREQETLKINVTGLKQGISTLEVDLSDDFFNVMEAPEIRGGRVSVMVEISRCDDTFDVSVRAEGVVTVGCDRCLDDLDVSIDTTSHLVILLGDEDAEQDDRLIVNAANPVADLSWYVCEQIVLAIPIKHVHQPGDCDDAMISRLDELNADRSSDGEPETSIDPRWSALLKMQTDNN